MINWNGIKVEQEIAQERYEQIVKSRQVQRAWDKAHPKVTFYDQVRGWLTALIGAIGVFHKQPVQCCVE